MPSTEQKNRLTLEEAALAAHGILPAEEGAPDGDGDGHDDNYDNCIGVSNPDQADSDCDGIGDACEGGGANIPAASDWGLAAMTLLVLTAATIVISIRRRRSAAA